MHGPTVDGEALGRGRPVPRSADELRAMILLRIEAMEVVRGVDDAGRAKVARPAVEGDRDDDA